MSSRHECPRCGVPLKWTHRSWADKHPAAAVTAGLVSLVFMGMMLSVHPVAAAVMLGAAGVWFGVRLWERSQHRRVALAARAEYENRKFLASPVQLPTTWLHRLAAEDTTRARR